ncbi:MAG: arginine--tRNA ligase [Clostridia bacterium]|nr:arginine--tRNA ligase [Clostridia bacterium]
MDYKEHIAERINIEGMTKEDVLALIATPPTSEMGDYALPCFKLAKIMRRSPALIAQGIAGSYETDDVICSAEALNGYVNFRVNKTALSKATLSEILSKGERYGADTIGEGKTICIDYSSVNIAKPFHIGHLSTTVIGSALYKIYKFLGYNVVGINHLGDYGTQFGKLICAYKHWGNEELLESGGIHAINDLYVRFNTEAEENEEMLDEAREYFRLIESHDPEAERLFNRFKEITLDYVKKIYKRLNVTFDSYNGERFYTDKMQPVIDELQEKGLLKESNGAKIVDLEPYGMPPCLILRSDGASLYATRDLAAAMYRKATYDFDKCLYVVAYQQNLHFRQIFKVIELMGRPWYKDLVHVAFGMVSLEDGAMSTRKGRVVWLEDVIDKCISKAYDVINEKNPDLENKDQTAETVGLGAVIFGALYNSRIKDITFSYDKVLSFEGETSVYVQYTCARANSVLSKAAEAGILPSIPEYYEPGAAEFEVIKSLAQLPQIIKDAAEKYEPSYVARFTVDLSQKFNKFYIDCKILTAEGDAKAFRLALCEATLTALKNAMTLLGIGVPDRM